MKLQLNLPALERLIGNDSEIEVELRHQIVEQFTKKHLKELVNDQLWKRVSSEMIQYVETVIKKEYNAESLIRNHGKYFVSNTLTSQIKGIASQVMHEEVKKEIDHVVNKNIQFWEKYIEGAISRGITNCIKKEVEKEVKRRLELTYDI